MDERPQVFKPSTVPPGRVECPAKAKLVDELVKRAEEKEGIWPRANCTAKLSAA